MSGRVERWELAPLLVVRRCGQASEEGGGASQLVSSHPTIVV
jgi:hypothetical protein